MRRFWFFVAACAIVTMLLGLVQMRAAGILHYQDVDVNGLTYMLQNLSNGGVPMSNIKVVERQETPAGTFYYRILWVE